MRKSRWRGAIVLAIASCAAAALGTAQAMSTTLTDGTDLGPYFESNKPTGNASTPNPALRVASRDMPERYFQAYQLIGSHVLNLDGERIGEVDNLILDEQGDVKQVLVALYDSSDTDGGSIAISPHRAEVVSTSGANVTVIRVDLTREELVQAQLVGLKSNARAPAPRGAGMPDLHREYGPLY
jgi:sporulation protein YlmC with PRC-barrel domain